MRRAPQPRPVEIVDQAIEARVIPGAVVLVRARGRLVLELVRGCRQLEPSREAMSRDTLFDLASLTKPLSTAILVLQLAEREHLGLDSELGRFLPDVCDESRHLTLRSLLLHTSGLAAVADLWQAFPDPSGIDREEAARKLLDRAPVQPPGTTVLYSCTGYLLLGLMLERLTGLRLKDLFRTMVAEPAGLDDLLFCPGGQDRQRTAATEFCPWRKRWIRGEVHDENSFCRGGDGGNAGLFGTADAVLELLSLFEGEGVVRGVGLLGADSERLLRTCLTPGMNRRRAIGFAMQDGESHVGPGFSMASFGHTGFTGTSVWVEPAAGLTTVILTNRVHLGRKDTEAPLKEFRIRLHTAIHARWASAA